MPLSRNAIITAMYFSIDKHQRNRIHVLSQMCAAEILPELFTLFVDDL